MIYNKGMPASGPHCQVPWLNWPQAAVLMRKGTWFKAIDHVQMFQQVKGISKDINTVLRHFDGGWQKFDFPDHASRRAHANAFLKSFVDGTFLDYAQYVDAIEEWNEYWASSHSASDKLKRELWVQAVCEEWSEMRNKDQRLTHIRLVVGNVAIGNDITLGAARHVKDHGAIVGYHPYVPYRHPSKVSMSLSAPAGVAGMRPRYGAQRASMRDRGSEPYPLEVTFERAPASYLSEVSSLTGVMPNEWPYLSGRWTTMDTQFRNAGVIVDWLGTEAGPIGFYDWGGLDPMAGWKHGDVCASDVNLYLGVLNYWTVKALAWNAANGHRMLGQVLYNSGGTAEWKHFETDTPTHIQIATIMKTYTDPPLPPPPPPPDPGPDIRTYAKKSHIVPPVVPRHQYDAIVDIAWPNKESTFHSIDDALQPAANSALVKVTSVDVDVWNAELLFPDQGLTEQQAKEKLDAFADVYYPMANLSYRRIGSLFVADSWWSPVGTEAERDGGIIWPGGWYDANTFGNEYSITPGGPTYFHPGCDLNMPGDADKNRPVYAMAGGKVVYAGVPSEAWQGVVIIRHTLPSGANVFSRTAHLLKDEIRVQPEQWVKKGAWIGLTGFNKTTLGQGPFHVHVEICKTMLVANDPGFWVPPNNLQIVLANWEDPKAWLLSHQ